jgi:hypothetical protein
MSKERQRAEMYAMIVNTIASDPDAMSVAIQAVTDGTKKAVENMNTMRVWADQSLMAATMLLSAKVQTQGLKKHLEFCITRYYEELGGGAGAATEWVKNHPANGG